VAFKTSADGKYFSSPVTVDFTVDQDYFKSIWFYVFLALAILISIGFISLFSHQRQKRRWAEEKQKIKLEFDLLKQKQKLGQLQLNPHFLFNTLNSISGLMALKETQHARKYLNAFSQMMRSLLDQSIQDNISVANEIRFLDQYLGLEQMIRNNKFDYQISNHCNADAQIPVMIIQPFVENAIIHGVAPMEGKGNIGITFEYNGNYILVKVKDNGIGRGQALVSKNPGHHSSAISIIKDRLRNMDKWRTEEHIVFEDLVEHHNIIKGTVVSIYIPQ
jgi:sensor histidine kinase YesM